MGGQWGVVSCILLTYCDFAIIVGMGGFCIFYFFPCEPDRVLEVFWEMYTKIFKNVSRECHSSEGIRGDLELVRAKDALLPEIHRRIRCFGPVSKFIESIRDFLVIFVGFGLDHKSSVVVVNTEDVKQTDLLVMWLLLLTPFNVCGFCPLFVLDPPASQQENRCHLQFFSVPQLKIS